MEKTEINLNEEEYPLVASDPQIIPDPTYWPIVLAFGITFLFWGYLTSLYLSCLGLICMIIALIGWIKDLNNEK